MSRASEISDEAADWLIRVEAQSTPELWEDLQGWLDAHPRHRAAFVRLRVAWHRADALKYLRPLDGAIDPDLLSSERSAAGSIATGGLQRRHLLLAASAVAAGGGVLWWSGILALESFATPVGGLREVVLQDGSTLRLNTNTRLQVHISWYSRNALLLRGETLFQVASDPRRPFEVHVTGATIRAVGTEFSVRVRDPERVAVLVAEGHVVVTAAKTGTSRDNDPRWVREVSTGQLAAITPVGVSVEQLDHSDVVDRLAWTAGQLIFAGRRLSEAVQEFNRYNARPIIIVDSELEGLRIGGTFSATDPVSFVAALQHSFPIRALESDSDIRLLLR
jgi:transmembrane sensor